MTYLLTYLAVMCVLGTSCMSWERRMVTMKPMVILLLRLMYSRTGLLHGNILRPISLLLLLFFLIFLRRQT